jgi:predicted DNA-binding protein YlxM (UPF0122 family)
MRKETWKAIPGYKGLYEISSHGQVRSLPREVRGKGNYTTKERMLKPWKNREYLQVSLTKKEERKRYYIHELVALTFIGLRPEGQEVRHDDGNKANNYYKNLLYGTRKQNDEDDVRNDNHQYGEKHGQSKLTAKQVGEIRSRYLDSEDIKNLAEEFEVSRQIIYYVVKNKTRDPRKLIEYIAELKKANKFKEAKRVEKELKIISPKGWIS